MKVVIYGPLTLYGVPGGSGPSLLRSFGPAAPLEVDDNDKDAVAYWSGLAKTPIVDIEVAAKPAEAPKAPPAKTPATN